MNTTEDNNSTTLTTKQKKFLKGLGHNLSPLVLVGKEGLTESLVAAVNLELGHHELIKVKIGNNSTVTKQEAALRLPEAVSCALVQLIGKTLLLYKENPQRSREDRIILPKA